MSKGKQTFRLGDLKRAIKAALDAGLSVFTVRSGEIEIVVGEAKDRSFNRDYDLDRELEEFEARLGQG
jgi:hypothetical protein